MEGMRLHEIAFIGDTWADAEAIEAVGAGFAPQNGIPAAKCAADLVTDGAVIDGVVETHQWCVHPPVGIQK